jgi:diguanylate cyclase
MSQDQPTWRDHIVPPIAPEIRDDFALLRAERLQQQSRLLFLSLLLTVPTTLWGAAPGTHAIVRYGFPLVMGFACIFGFLSLTHMPKIDGNVRRARHLIRRATIDSTVIAVLCSSWSVLSWFGAAPGTQIYYPMILTMGALATAYCLSTIRLAAVLNISIALVPILVLLALSGTRMDFVFANSLLLAAAFMIHMVISQHKQLSAMLTLQRRMRMLAETDPLTGLANRRVLADRIDALLAVPRTQARPFTLAMFDLDGFKPINDRLGHAAGDDLLCIVGERLKQAAGPTATMARIGGDEFAVLFPGADASAGQALAAGLLATLVQPVVLGEEVEHIGASAGTASWPTEGATREDLFRKADLALYTSKAGRHRSRAVPRRHAIA